MNTMKKIFTGLALGAVGLALLSFLLPALGIGGVATAGCSACCACIAGLCCGAGLTAAAASSSGRFDETAHNQANVNNGYYFNYGDSGNEKNNARYNDDEFEEMIQNTRNEVENNTNSNNQHIITAQPYSGVYNTSFIDPDSGTRHDAILNLYFTKDFNGCGYRISGQGNDIDGETVIEDGFVTNDGDAAWWRERTITGDVGLQVLSKGRFDFQQRAFYGVWMANTRITASYISFCASDANITTVGSDGNPIPVAHAIPNHNNSQYSNASSPPAYDPPQHAFNTTVATKNIIT